MIDSSCRDDRHGFAVRYPLGWRRAPQSLAPHLSDPRELFSVATLALPDRRSNGCAQVPVGGLNRLGRRDAFVSLQERAGVQSRDFGPPQAEIRLRQAPPSDATSCLAAAASKRIETYFVAFRSGRRGFYAVVGLGRSASAQRRRDVLAILRGFEAFGPGRSKLPSLP